MAGSGCRIDHAEILIAINPLPLDLARRPIRPTGLVARSIQSSDRAHFKPTPGVSESLAVGIPGAIRPPANIRRCRAMHVPPSGALCRSFSADRAARLQIVFEIAFDP